MTKRIATHRKPLSLKTDGSLTDGNKQKKSGLEYSKEEAPAEELSSQKRAYYQLVSKEKGFRNISVLHQLMKRQVIEENKLRFKESIKFISDYPFELQFLSKAKNFEYVAGAAYIKRNHGDSVNLPSLSQMKGSRSFREYTDTYRYAIGLLHKNKDLKLLLQEKNDTVLYPFLCSKAPGKSRGSGTFEEIQYHA